MGDPSFIILMVAMFAMMYFFMIRPENKRKKEAQNLRDSLKVGDVITTIGGIVGTICKVDESTIVIETGADRVRILPEAVIPPEREAWPVLPRQPDPNNEKWRERNSSLHLFLI